MNKATAILLLVAIGATLVILTWNVFTKPQAENVSPILAVPTTKPHHSSGGSGGTYIGPPSASPDDPNASSTPEPTIDPKLVQLWANEEATTPIQNIEWGNLTVGGTSTRTFYVKNDSNESIAGSVTSYNWYFYNMTNHSPLSTAIYQQYFNITWDFDEAVIDPHSIVCTQITLTVSPQMPLYSPMTFGCNLQVNYHD